LKDFDYSREGAYFITICTHHRRCILGGIIGGEMMLNELGKIVRQEWYRSVARRAEIRPDAFVVMPNHIHGILFICSVGASGCSPRTGAHRTTDLRNHDGFDKRSLPSFVAGFKAAVTTRINALQGAPGRPFWQRNYHERIIRNEEMLFRCRTYIEHNPLRWAMDKENPKNKTSGG
jgi:REP element-mobilizing transposase RayT